LHDEDVHPDIASIVAADRAAQRELDALSVRLASAARASIDQEARERAAAEAAARSQLDAEAAALRREGDARLTAARASRAAERDRRRECAAAVVEQAVSAYVAIVRGKEP